MDRSDNGRVMRIAEKWQNAINISNKGYYITYIGMFAAFFLCFVFGYVMFGCGFIWATDGLEQQYMFFILQGEWLRELLSNIFIEHTFTIPMWTDMVGYGADYVVSVGNTLGNPILAFCFCNAGKC